MGLLRFDLETNYWLSLLEMKFVVDEFCYLISGFDFTCSSYASALGEARTAATTTTNCCNVWWVNFEFGCLFRWVFIVSLKIVYLNLCVSYCIVFKFQLGRQYIYRPIVLLLDMNKSIVLCVTSSFPFLSLEFQHSGYRKQFSQIWF